MLSWAATMFAWNAKPPNPRYFGGSWIEEWRKRLEKASKSWDSIWLLNNDYNNYWKNGSICEDYSRVDIPGKQIIGIDLKLIKNQYFQVLLQDVTRKLRKFAKALNFHARARPLQCWQSAAGPIHTRIPSSGWWTGCPSAGPS